MESLDDAELESEANEQIEATLYALLHQSLLIIISKTIVLTDQFCYFS